MVGTSHGDHICREGEIRTPGPVSGQLHTKSSVIGRLLEELSWEGPKIRRYRNGGRGIENVLTAEVLLSLSYLPRTPFLGGVLSAAHGAEATRTLVGQGLENATLELFPEEITLQQCDIGVQPDA